MVAQTSTNIGVYGGIKQPNRSFQLSQNTEIDIESDQSNDRMLEYRNTPTKYRSSAEKKAVGDVFGVDSDEDDRIFRSLSQIMNDNKNNFKPKTLSESATK